MAVNHVTLQFDRIESQQNPTIGAEVEDVILGRRTFKVLQLAGGEHGVARGQNQTIYGVAGAQWGSNITKLVFTVNGGSEDVIDVHQACVVHEYTINVGGNDGDKHMITMYAEDSAGNKSQTLQHEVTGTSTNDGSTPMFTNHNIAQIASAGKTFELTVTDPHTFLAGGVKGSGETSDWEFASDVNFTNLIHKSIGDSTNVYSYTLDLDNLSEWTSSNGDFLGILYARQRYNVPSPISITTPWTPYMTIDTAGSLMGIGRTETNDVVTYTLS